jgi:hypothetical protein
MTIVLTMDWNDECLQRFLPTNLLGKNEGDVIPASYHIRALRYPTWIATTPLTTDISLSPLYRDTHTHDNPHTHTHTHKFHSLHYGSLISV